MSTEEIQVEKIVVVDDFISDTSEEKHNVSDDEAVIDISKEGWDSEMISYPYVFNKGNNLIMLYNGNGFGKIAQTSDVSVIHDSVSPRLQNPEK